MELHPTKTRIYKISERIGWLGFTYQLKPTGFVCIRCKPEKIRDNRRRFARFVESIKAGRMTLEKADEMVDIVIQYLRKNCNNRRDPVKLEQYWQRITEELRDVR